MTTHHHREEYSCATECFSLRAQLDFTRHVRQRQRQRPVRHLPLSGYRLLVQAPQRTMRKIPYWIARHRLPVLFHNTRAWHASGRCQSTFTQHSPLTATDIFSDWSQLKSRPAQRVVQQQHPVSRRLLAGPTTTRSVCRTCSIFIQVRI